MRIHGRFSSNDRQAARAGRSRPKGAGIRRGHRRRVAAGAKRSPEQPGAARAAAPCIAYFCSTPPSPTRTTGSPPKTDGLSTETVDESVHPTRNTATAQAGRAGCAASSMTGRSGRHGAGLAGGQFYRRPAWPMAWHGRCARQRHRAGRAGAGPVRSNRRRRDRRAASLPACLAGRAARLQRSADARRRLGASRAGEWPSINRALFLNE